MPGALALGLLASVLGHSAAFGSQHEMGGAYHETLVALLTSSLGVAALAVIFLAVAGAKTVQEGSVLAARLCVFVPGIPLLTATSCAWYQFFESVEGAHRQAPFLVVAAMLVAAVLAVHGIVRWFIAFVAALVFCIVSNAFDSRGRCWTRQIDHPLPVQFDVALRRRFARPPPV